MVRGIILAAGASSRMGRPKATLQLSRRGDTFLSRIIETFIATGLPDIVVVTGSTIDVHTSVGAMDRRVHFVHNPCWSDGQLSSLLVGLGPTLGSIPCHSTLEAVMVNLVDVPLVSPATCRRVLRAWRATGAPIVRPASGTRHGHPVIFDRAVFAELRDADLRVGAKAVVRAHAHEIVDVPVEDEGAFIDVDTEQDYRALRSVIETGTRRES
jgi:molybdenum cofactor cytidylyltransferase